MALPTFLIIGAAKAGTTSLHHYLQQHPDIQLPDEKEPQFFSGPPNGIPYPMPRIASIEAYEKLFDPSARARGEASPSYTNHPRRKGVPERIRDLVPDVKLIYLVRDPVDRTVSHYMHAVSNGRERRSLPEALADMADPCCPYTCPSRYASQLELYLRVFPEMQMLVIDQLDLLNDRRAILASIFKFLGVDDTFVSPQFEDELYRSSERRHYPAGYARLVARTVTPALRWAPLRMRGAIRSSVERLLFPTAERPKLEQGLRSQLEELLAPEVERLRASTGRSFDSWCV
jgi:hypothetical protein